MWLGEYPSAWQKILKPKVKYASGNLKATADTEAEGSNKLILVFEDGNGAKPIIAKKVAKFVKKTAKVKVEFSFGVADTESEQIIAEATEVGSATTSPYSRIVQLFKAYQTELALKKIPVLIKLNTLFEEWDNYDDALKASEQKEKNR